MSSTTTSVLPPLVKSDTFGGNGERPRIITGGHWAFRGESIWSIFHKLAYLNDFSARDIVRCFGTTDAQSRPLVRTAERDLRIPAGFDIAKIADTVGLSIEEILWSFYEHYVLDASSRGAAVLRYCPECIKLGIHTALHQSPALLACPWHEVPLVSTCPNCGGVQFYELNMALLRSPYACRCGYSFWPDQDNTPWKNRFEESQGRDLEEFVNWIAPVRDARKRHSKRYVILQEDEHDKLSLDDVLFELNRIYPGPAWLNRCLGDQLIQDEQDPQRFVYAQRRKVFAARVASRNDMRINIESMLENPNDPYFVGNVLKPVRASLRRLKTQIQRVFLKHHAHCADEVVFANGQLYTVNRTGKTCLWASAYAMWDKTTYYLFDETSVSVPLTVADRVPADHLGIYLKWQQVLRLFVLKEAEAIDKDILDLLAVAFQRWLRLRISQQFLYCVGIVNDIANPYCRDPLDGEQYPMQGGHDFQSLSSPLSIATIELEPPRIRIDVHCSYNWRAAARAAVDACMWKKYSWLNIYRPHSYRQEIVFPRFT